MTAVTTVRLPATATAAVASAQDNLIVVPSGSDPPWFDPNDRSLIPVYCFVKKFISASGTSGVAIDNKIEQAMDLVKSHLMFAVREEVEVLKEKIAELMDRINQLEVENAFLKANASPETLAQLASCAMPPPAASLLP